jgi:hypothetical protein
MPSRWAVRVMRREISPRLAMRMRSNTTGLAFTKKGF